MWDSIKRKSLGHDRDQADSMNKVDENGLMAKYDEDRQRWEEEKKDLTEQLNVAKSILTEKEKVHSMFGNFNWD
ncbi:hypothetical protein OIU76_013109 [Salix suchowensis]|nr:hypothetical protein OIU76_013109 [Salix suchowensis]